MLFEPHTIHCTTLLLHTIARSGRACCALCIIFAMYYKELYIVWLALCVMYDNSDVYASAARKCERNRLISEKPT